MFDLAINSSSSPTCNFVQATNKMKTIVAMLHSVQERKTLQVRKEFQKTLNGVRKKEIAYPFKLLAMQ